MKTPAKMLQFATDQSGTGNEELVLKLMTMTQLPKAPCCTNCRQEDCQNGKLIMTSDKFYVGCQVSMNRDSVSYWRQYGGVNGQKVYTVKALPQIPGNHTLVAVHITDNENGQQNVMFMLYQNNYTFCYKCE